MRKIAFRAWDNKNNKWVVCDIGQTTTPEEARKNPFPVSVPVVFDGGDDCVIQQFTGLTDKNGVEIYEGDIVKCFYADGDVIGLLEIKIPDCFYGERREMEVIGNIYENPDLLK